MERIPTGPRITFFVVYSSDTKRIELAREELAKLLAHENWKNVVLLVFANQQDGAVMDGQAIVYRMNRVITKDRQWYGQGTSAISGQGLAEGITWLIKELQAKKK